MDEKEIRKMNRSEVAALITSLQKTIGDLENKVKVLEQQNSDMDRVNHQLAMRIQDRTLKAEKAGSLAEQAAMINDLFAKAQSTADDYLKAVKDANQRADENIQKRMEQAEQEADELVAKARNDAEAMTLKAKSNVKALLEEAVNYRKRTMEESERLVQKTKDECAELRTRTNVDVTAQWLSFQDKMDSILEKCTDLKKLLASVDELKDYISSRTGK